MFFRVKASVLLVIRVVDVGTDAVIVLRLEGPVPTLRGSEKPLSSPIDVREREDPNSRSEVGQSLGSVAEEASFLDEVDVLCTASAIRRSSSARPELFGASASPSEVEHSEAPVTDDIEMQLQHGGVVGFPGNFSVLIPGTSAPRGGRAGTSTGISLRRPSSGACNTRRRCSG